MKSKSLLLASLLTFAVATSQEIQKTKEKETAAKVAADAEFQNKKADEAVEKQKAKRKEMKEKAAVKEKEATEK